MSVLGPLSGPPIKVHDVRQAALNAEGVLAVRLSVTADDRGETTHAHPALPEAMREATPSVRDA